MVSLASFGRNHKAILQHSKFLCSVFLLHERDNIASSRTRSLTVLCTRIRIMPAAYQ